MNGMNRVVLMGHLGGEPRAGATPSGRRVTSFNIATNEFIRSSEGEKTKRTDWHKITTWGKTAEACEKMLRKGSFVLVEGKIRNIVNREGVGPSYEVFATDVSFISNYGNDQSKQENLQYKTGPDSEQELELEQDQKEEDDDEDDD
ncbi:MAG: single-stranded DNA-binding protein [bacterium]